MRPFLFIICFLPLTLAAQQTGPFPESATLLTLDSVIIKAADIVQPGKLTMVVFWNSMMRPAFNELDSLHKVYPQWQEKYGVEIVTVAWEYPKFPDNLKKFLGKREWKFPIYLDTEKNFGGALLINTYPTTYLIDKQGKLVHKTTGFDAAKMLKFEAMLKELSRE